MKVLKNLLKNNQSNLLSSLGRDGILTVETLENCKEFIRSAMYGGKPQENYIETRIRIYKRLKTK